jgi:hypothetical protein
MRFTSWLLTLAFVLAGCSSEDNEATGGASQSTAGGATAGEGGATVGEGGGGSSSGGAAGSPSIDCDEPLPEGTAYYVDGSCEFDGDGLADGCASAVGAPGAFVDPQSCFSLVQGGETCLIKDGTYLTTNNGSDPNDDGGFVVMNSGTAESPIVIRAYPGHSPLLANCLPELGTYCPRPTISAPGRTNVVFACLRVHGGYSIQGSFDYTGGVVTPYGEGIVIRGSEVTQGWGEQGDGNWFGIWLGQQNGAHLHHNYIHDISVQEGGGQQSSGSCVKLYHNTGSIIEYNTCRTVTIPETQAGGIDDKAQAIDNIHRYNWIEDVPTCIRVNNQLESHGVQIYQNVCIAGQDSSAGLKLLTTINGIDVHHNTFDGFSMGLMVSGSEGPVANARLFDNIFANIGMQHLEAYGYAPVVHDYNAYSAGVGFLFGGEWYANLAELQAATPLDHHSQTVDCQLDSDRRLSPGSACIGAGSSDGTPSGSAVDLGAYVDGIDCLGHGC